MRRDMSLLATCTAVILSACSTTVNVPSDTSLQNVLLAARKSSSVVSLRNGTAIEADSIILDADAVIAWHNEAAVKIRIDSLARISTRSTGRGVGDGLKYGFLGGAGVGILWGATNDNAPSSWSAGSSALFGGMALGVIGGLTGALVGGLAGSWTEYDLTDSTFAGAGPVAPGVTIVVPAIELEDEERIAFVWRGRIALHDPIIP